MELSIKQINELITGIILSAEISSSSPKFRHFVSVGGYIEVGRGKKTLDRFINDEKIRTTFFWIRDYEVPKIYIENDLEIPDDQIINHIYTESIIGINSLQEDLKKHISDFSLLVPHWETDAPIG